MIKNISLFTLVILGLASCVTEQSDIIKTDLSVATMAPQILPIIDCVNDTVLIETNAIRKINDITYQSVISLKPQVKRKTKDIEIIVPAGVEKFVADLKVITSSGKCIFNISDDSKVLFKKTIEGKQEIYRLDLDVKGTQKLFLEIDAWGYYKNVDLCLIDARFE